MKQVQSHMGICPQHDIHWDDLTIEEHLLFYARLKDVSKHDESRVVEKSMADVGLTGMGTRLAKALSGGEKRRLSIAIALVGNPSVVFLDEPTTGLDPEVRRIVWNIIQKSRQDKTIILTTHSMEEAEALCQRIGIMVMGSLQCIGSQHRLKEVYGSGFRLSFTSESQDLTRSTDFITKTLTIHCSQWTKLSTFSTQTSFEFKPSNRGCLGSLFEDIERAKAENGIQDWGLSQTTLEVFFTHFHSLPRKYLSRLFQKLVQILIKRAQDLWIPLPRRWDDKRICFG